MTRILAVEKLATGKEGRLLFAVGHPVLNSHALNKHKIVYGRANKQQGKVVSITPVHARYLIQFEFGKSLQLNRSKIFRTVMGQLLGIKIPSL